MKNVEDATLLAEKMVAIGRLAGVETVATLTNMNQPLGDAVGNSLEVIEAINTLKGEGPKDFTELCYALTSEILLIAKVCETEEDAYKLIDELIKERKGLKKLAQMIEYQHGNSSVCENIDLFKKAKEQNIHTCIDTSGATYNPDNAECVERFTELVKHTDLVMLDIKHIDSAAHKTLTGMDNKNILAFAKFLEEKNIALWIRHIILKGYTDKPDDLIRLGNFIGKLKNLKALDVLPYHTMGVGKYKQLNIPYPLEGVEALPIADAVSAKEHILEGIKQVRK
jgi:pyruvate-formate lyase-activating enzyme